MSEFAAFFSLQTFCNLHQIKMDGGVRLTAGPSGNEHIAEIDVPDRKYAEELVKEYDGKVLPGTVKLAGILPNYTCLSLTD